MTLPAGLSKYRGKRENSSRDPSDQRKYIRFFELPPGKDLGDVTGLSRGDLVPEETDIYVSDVSIVNDKDTKGKPGNMVKIVQITGYKNKEWS